MTAAVPRQVYLLAAGRGTRMGTPKAWRVQEGRPLLQRQLDFLLGRFTPDEIAVSIQEAWLDRCRSLNPALAWVPADPDRPPLASLIALVRARPPRAWSFVYHVDMPVWEPALFELLSANAAPAEAAGEEAVAPVKDGRQGHPVLLSPAALGGVSGLDPAKGRLDHWLHGRKVRKVEVPFSCIHANWNDPGAA